MRFSLSIFHLFLLLPLTVAVPFGNWQFSSSGSVVAWSGFIKTDEETKHWNKCNDEGPQGCKYVPHVYFQDNSGAIREAVSQNEDWEEGNGGAAVAQAALNSPIAVLNWWEGSSATPVILLFHLDNNGRAVGFAPEDPGSLSVTLLDNEVFLIFQTPQATVDVCRYFWSSTAVCSSQAESWGGALPGTSTAVFRYDAGHPHIYYQGANYPYPTLGQYWDGGKWNTGTMQQAAIPRTQIAAAINRMGKSTPWSGYGANFFSNDNQIYNCLTWSPWDGGLTCGG
ncbi:hypothetical protein B0T14DRAFT_566534 [Immersiella caudata]|uniref:Uncharacterized protein n=1 Tax=Immersiella caudata TaxID=314043 RepID=A0AA39WQG5_9PEZI|nr:hypothetical protein B0T14DRAFT_566534 [Immersiella caudata]